MVISEVQYLDVREKFERARFLSRSGRYGLAVEELQSALSLAPENWLLLTELADNCLLLKKYEESEDYARRAIESEPDNFSCHWSLANVLEDTERREEALVSLEYALELAPECAPLHSAAASLCLLLRRFSKAWELAQKSITLDPENKYCLLTYARVCIYYSRRSEARVLLEDLQQIHPECSRVRKLIAELDHGSGLYRQARLHAAEALELEPENEAAQRLHSSAESILLDRGDLVEDSVERRELWPGGPLVDKHDDWG